MKQTVWRSALLSAKYSRVTLESGLPVYFYHDPEASSATACFAVHYGSVDNRFRESSDSEIISVPEGIAHFLEHKLFEDEKGDAFLRFAETGASANAFTSDDRTVYYFKASDRFEENLAILLDFVSTPYFTEKTVEKEQGIIGQEIGMYDDNPDWQVYFGMLQGLYHKHSIRIDTAGSVSSIAKITPELLYRAYDIFYRPENMVLTVSGNFDPKEVLRLCGELLPKRPGFTAVRLPEEEPKSVYRQVVKKTMPVSKTQFCLGFKQTPSYGEERLRTYVMNNLAAECLFGEATPFYREMYDKGIINSCFGSGVLDGEGYLVLYADGETDRYETMVEAMKKRILHLQQNGPEKEIFEGSVRTHYADEVRRFNNPGSLAVQMVDACFSGTNLFDTAEILKAVTPEELQKFICEMLDPENFCISLILPETERSMDQ